jgi:hypothetical protein
MYKYTSYIILHKYILHYINQDISRYATNVIFQFRSGYAHHFAYYVFTYMCFVLFLVGISTVRIYYKIINKRNKLPSSAKLRCNSSADGSLN